MSEQIYKTRPYEIDDYDFVYNTKKSCLPKIYNIQLGRVERRETKRNVFSVYK